MKGTGNYAKAITISRVLTQYLPSFFLCNQLILMGRRAHAAFGNICQWFINGYVPSRSILKGSFIFSKLPLASYTIKSPNSENNLKIFIFISGKKVFLLYRTWNYF